MAITKREKLFTEFPPVPTEKWEEVITADLKGADYERKLVWKTGEGFNVRPYYRAENLEGIKFLGSQAGEFPYVRGTHAHNRWRVHQTVSVVCPKEANAEALKILNAGVDSLGFCIASADFSAADLDMLLKDICIPAVEITFCGEKMANVAELVLAKVEKEGIAKEDVRIAFCIDPLVKGLSSKGDFCSPNGEKCIARIVELIHKTKEYKHVRIVTVAGQTFGNSGSTIVEELAFTLSAGHDYLVRLTDAGLDVDAAARKLRFSFSVTSNYFMEIAKFRAARMLWANIVAQYEPSCECAAKMFAHAVTSRWNMTVYDPYVNMLRGTTEAMSAAIAGVHSIEVLPFDAAYEKPTDFSARIARNVQLLLKEESHFNQVCDAAGGSYYIENLTASIAEQAWSLFKQVEEKGGYIAAFEAGFVQDQVEASAAKKNLNIAKRRETLLGTNQFPNFNEVAGDEITEEVVTGKSSCRCGCSSQAPEGVRTLKPYRGAMAFEQMRLKVDRSGKSPKAFMVTVGALAFARARAQFSCNFFACAGIRVQDNTYFHSVEEGIRAAVEAKADIVVICASDDDYATLAPEAYKLLDGRAIFVVAGAPACKDELEAQGIKNFISIRDNVLETLHYYLKELGI